MRKGFISFFVLLGVVGCSSTPDQPKEETTPAPSMVKEYQYVPLNVPFNQQASFDTVYRQWKGTPYRLGGTSRQGIDCSAFVQVGYADVHNLRLPRTTSQQVKLGKWVALKEVQEGDLVFFKTGRDTRHVGIYVGESRFLHASTSQGVMISSLQNPYWRSVYWQSRRIDN
ncbi:NlpC/P60 family protein [Photobacterium makurazakiensis]|uniref:NlpC/P60 family protein n=1 Tax=Photobacterium makurazakiensis TaxID=2910234 RepID=UPI003D126D3D